MLSFYLDLVVDLFQKTTFKYIVDLRKLHLILSKTEVLLTTNNYIVFTVQVSN